MRHNLNHLNPVVDLVVGWEVRRLQKSCLLESRTSKRENVSYFKRKLGVESKIQFEDET